MTFERFRFGGAVTPRERAFYDEHGFIVYEGFLGTDEVAQISAEADAYQDRIRRGEISSAHIDQVAPKTLGVDGNIKYRHRLNYFTQHSLAAGALAASDRVQAIRTGIGGDEFWLLSDTMNGAVWQLKSGEAKSGYTRIRWHLDFPVNHPLSPAFTAGFYLDDSTRDNGCLAVIPGSHRFPVGPVQPEPLYVEVRAGDLICHHERIYHGSEAMTRSTDRRATLYFYYCAGTHPGADQPFAKLDDMESIQSIFVGAPAEVKE
ncbi:phytanoyl-CoA dioxygenase family protein [Streptomyces sp. NBC_01794]|uniref:phytanoyl-CoA dioxygenase family protein n=1 Tax=Streptomyces sp. NBC_01794 TaxID=2975942 RepID=UPI0030847ED1|nr:phytanoyl-CoA dioxygenase family protein [Streptomyces sp. NBC_01794]